MMTTDPTNQIPTIGSRQPSADSVAVSVAKKRRLPPQVSLSQVLQGRELMSEHLAAGTSTTAWASPVGGRSQPRSDRSQPPAPLAPTQTVDLPELRCGTRFAQALRHHPPLPAIDPLAMARASSQVSGSLPATPVSALVDMLEESASMLIDYLAIVGGLASADVGDEDCQKLVSTFAVLTQVAKLAGSGGDASGNLEGQMATEGARKRKRSQAAEAHDGDDGRPATKARRQPPPATAADKPKRSHHKKPAHPSHCAPPTAADPPIPKPEHSNHQTELVLRAAPTNSADPPSVSHDPTDPDSNYVPRAAPPARAVYMPADSPTSSLHLQTPSDPATDKFSAWAAALRMIEPTRRLPLTAAIEASRIAGAQAASETGAASVDEAGDEPSNTGTNYSSTTDQHDAAPVAAAAAVAYRTAPGPNQSKPTPPTAATIPQFAYPYAGLTGNGHMPGFPPTSSLPRPYLASPYLSAAQLLSRVSAATSTSFSNTLARAQAAISTKASHQVARSTHLSAAAALSASAAPSCASSTSPDTPAAHAPKPTSTSTISVAYGWSKEEVDLLTSLIAQHGRAYSLFLHWHGPRGTKSRALAKFDSTRHLAKRWLYMRDQRAMHGMPALPEGDTLMPSEQAAVIGEDVRRIENGMANQESSVGVVGKGSGG